MMGMGAWWQPGGSRCASQCLACAPNVGQIASGSLSYRVPRTHINDLNPIKQIRVRNHTRFMFHYPACNPPLFGIEHGGPPERSGEECHGGWKTNRVAATFPACAARRRRRRSLSTRLLEPDAQAAGAFQFVVGEPRRRSIEGRTRARELRRRDSRA